MLRSKFLAWGQREIEKGRWYLISLSFFYAFGSFIRNFLYDKKWLKSIEVKPVVVSIGNIVAGGTGKTPFVHLLASYFSKSRVAILTRGYGEVPDEAMLLGKKLPKVAIFIGKKRGEMARRIQADLIILDDGFQHRKLKRDFEIVLMGKEEKYYLPGGFLRDSPKRLKMADEIFYVGRDFELKVKKIVDSQGREVKSIQGWKVDIFCGIANPERFKKTVESLGAEVGKAIYLGDHERVDIAKLPKERALVCTEKDFVKLPPHSLPIYCIEVEVVMTGGAQRWEKLIEKIGQKIDNGRIYE